MFARLFAVAAVAAFVAAQECTTSPIYCCDEYLATPMTTETVLKTHKIVDLSDPSTLDSVCNSGGLVSVGGGTTCTQQPICCNDNEVDSLVGILCSPISINI